MFEKLFKGKSNSINKKSSQTSLEVFISKSPHERLKYILSINSYNNLENFKILEYVIYYDNDFELISASLKRIGKFKRDDLLIPILNELKKKDHIKNHEPYFSMLLLNVGMITKEEFNNIFD